MERPTVQLIGEDGTAYGIMGRVRRALAHAGADNEYTNKYIQESMLGTYEQLIPTALKYVNAQ
jgi:hypothetical protein